MEVNFSAKAEKDLDKIYRYIHADSSEGARKWYGELVQTIRSLRQMPERGSVLADKPHFRQILYGSYPHVYRVIYSVHSQRQIVTIAHIRHGARQGSGV